MNLKNELADKLASDAALEMARTNYPVFFEEVEGC